MRRRFILLIILLLIIFVILVFRRQFLFRKNTHSLSPVSSGNSLNLITKKGGRVAWYHGTAHSLIAFDAVVNEFNKNTEIYTMVSSGANRQCVTCKASLRRGFIGQPDWHPDGDNIVFQVENANSTHGVYNHISFGIDNDLWIINKDGSNAQKIWESPALHAALHPHFNEDGTLLIFSERLPTGKSNPAWTKLTPGGENPWDGWQIHIASVDMTKKGTAILFNHRVVKPVGAGFYETHNFHGKKIIFSYTVNGQAYVDDIYQANLDGTGVENFIQSPTTWDEHGIFSPSGNFLSFISSRADTNWVAPKSRANTLRTELFLKKSQSIEQLTNFNVEMNRTRYLVSDYDWNRDGTQIVLQVAPSGGLWSFDPEIWLLTFPSAQY